jgi:diadenosine tetraphosphate (Ap4A) HIT family hydrolase
VSGDELDEADEMELSGADFTEWPSARLDAVDITRRARDAYGANGRLALPPQVTWPIFPFEVDGLRTRLVEDPVLPEPPRRGETAEDCSTCKEPDDRFVWTDQRWLVSMPSQPASLPILTLHTRAHLDFHQLTDELAAELGVLMIRVQRALSSIPGVGRVHVYKWGDGGAHLHVVLVARPLGMRQLWGMFLSTWMNILPPLPADEWAAIRDHVTVQLSGGGSSPPREADRRPGAG